MVSTIGAKFSMKSEQPVSFYRKRLFLFLTLDSICIAYWGITIDRTAVSKYLSHPKQRGCKVASRTCVAFSNIVVHKRVEHDLRVFRSGIQQQYLESAHEHEKRLASGLPMKPAKHFNAVEAREIGEALSIDWGKVDFDQFTMGLQVELEHGKRDSATNVTNDDPLLTGKVALAHLREFPDYYSRLAKLEKEAEQAKKAKH